MVNGMTSKSCSKCKELKSIESFQIDKSRKDGLQPYCKECRKNHQKNYYLTHKQKFNEKQKLNRMLNKDAINEYARNYYQLHKAKQSERKRIYNLKNPEVAKNASAKRRSRQMKNGIYLVTSKELKSLYKSNCFYCGSNEKIEIDHIIPISRGGSHSIGNLVPACLSCNRSKNNKLLVEWKLQKV